MNLNKNVAIPIIIIVAVFLLGVGIVFSGVADDIIFDQIPYNYTSYVSIPANSAGQGSWGGYYNIYGKGRNFKFDVKIPGAQKPYLERKDYSDFLTYTEDGLNGTGKINEINLTYQTLISLIKGDFKGALFNTHLNGVFNITCAGWTGDGTFNNNGKNFTGTFRINGVHTYWQGNYSLVNEGDRIAVPAHYLFYPQGRPQQITKVNKTFYM